MLSPELLKKIQRIYIKSNYLANDIFSGEYESAFRGRGMEFEEVREYFPGDDIRTIDWNVTARMDKAYVKVFREEREQTVILVVDGSASQNFGSRNRLKREMAAEVAAVLAYAAVKSKDKVGLIIFTDKVERFIPPKKGRGHVWHVISEILSFKPTGLKTNLNEALTFLIRSLHRRAVCFIISDFLDTPYEKSLKMGRFKHDLVLFHLTDPIEETVEKGGWMTLKDLESGSLLARNLGSPSVRRSFTIEQNKEIQKRKNRFTQAGVDSLFLRTDRDAIPPLLQFFRMREKRR